MSADITSGVDVPQPAKVGNLDDAEYDRFRTLMNARLHRNTAEGQPLFTTDAATHPPDRDLFLEWLVEFDPAERQYHDCSACRDFVRRYGGLVTIDDAGCTAPAFWSVEDAPPLYVRSVQRMATLAGRAKVTGVFRTSERELGQTVTGIWQHMALSPPSSCRHRGRLLSAGQSMAEKREDFKNVVRALSEFTTPVLEQAVTLLQMEALYRAEHVLGPVRWLRDLRVKIDGFKDGMVRQHLIWRAIATAPAGFCHPRASMAGTLLEDLAAGMAFDEVSRRFAAKMHPLQYQRPQAPPTAGNIAQAEKIVEQLGLAPALRRRFARVDEVQALWQPLVREPAPAREGVFGHLTPKGMAPVASAVQGVPPQTVTFEKFRRTVLPDAEEMKLQVPRVGNFAALVTAADPDAPPILQWDLPERRNPFSWYLYHGGSGASQWGLQPESFVAVPKVVLQPNLWGDEEGKYAHQGKGVLFVLAGARDTPRQGSLGLFPELLKAELREVRATIEAYSRSGKLEESEAGAALASGLMFQSSKSHCEWRLRVRARGQWTDYRIDRWD
jgi:hypothetical protein